MWNFFFLLLVSNSYQRMMAGWFLWTLPHATQNTKKHNALFGRVYVEDFLAKTRNPSTPFYFSVIIQCLIKTLGSSIDMITILTCLQVEEKKGYKINYPTNICNME